MDEQRASRETQTGEGGSQYVEKGLATWEEYRNVVRVCRDAKRKAKAHLELNLARDIKGNKKGFFKYISSTRKTEDPVGPVLNKVGALVPQDAEKVELLNASFASVFTAKAGPQASQPPEERIKLGQRKTYHQLRKTGSGITYANWILANP